MYAPRDQASAEHQQQAKHGTQQRPFATTQPHHPTILMIYAQVRAAPVTARRQAVVAAAVPKKILMMGGTRFIGLYLARQLVAEGHDVTLFTRGKAEICPQIPDDTPDFYRNFSSYAPPTLCPLRLRPSPPPTPILPPIQQPPKVRHAACIPPCDCRMQPLAHPCIAVIHQRVQGSTLAPSTCMHANPPNATHPTNAKAPPSSPGR